MEVSTSWKNGNGRLSSLGVFEKGDKQIMAKKGWGVTMYQKRFPQNGILPRRHPLISAPSCPSCILHLLQQRKTLYMHHLYSSLSAMEEGTWKSWRALHLAQKSSGNGMKGPTCLPLVSDSSFPPHLIPVFCVVCPCFPRWFSSLSL